jgi:amidase
MARTIGDVQLMFRALSGQDASDPLSPPLALREPTLEELRATPVGFFEDDELVPVTTETRAAVQAAAQALRAAGFKVEPFRPRALEQLRKLWWKFFVQCGAMFYAPTIAGKHAQLSPIFEEFLEISDSAAPLTANELLQAWAELDLLRAKTLEEMSAHPVLLCPVASVPAWRHGERRWNIDGYVIDYLDAVRHTQWFNALAAPAAVVPMGRAAEENGIELPIGVQIVARAFEDETALGVAAILDAAFGYRPPPMALSNSYRPESSSLVRDKSS